MKLALKTWHELDMNLEHGHDTRMNMKMANSRLDWVCSVNLPETARQIQLLQTIGSNVGSWSYRTWKPEVRLSCGVNLPGTARHIQWPQQQVWCERLGCINELMPRDRVKSSTWKTTLNQLDTWFVGLSHELKRQHLANLTWHVGGLSHEFKWQHLTYWTETLVTRSISAVTHLDLSRYPGTRQGGARLLGWL